MAIGLRLRGIVPVLLAVWFAGCAQPAAGPARPLAVTVTAEPRTAPVGEPIAFEGARDGAGRR
jgi:hypothetical protein